MRFLDYFLEGIKGVPDIIIDVMCNPGVIALMLTIIVSNVFGFWYAVLFFIGLIILFAIFYAIAMKLEEE